MILNLSGSAGGGGGSHTVTIEFIEPRSPESFESCNIYEYDIDGETTGSLIGTIDSVTGNTTVVTSSGAIYIELNGNFVSPPRYVGLLNGAYMTGGVGYTNFADGGHMIFTVSGDGSITVGNIDWSD